MSAAKKGPEETNQLLQDMSGNVSLTKVHPMSGIIEAPSSPGEERKNMSETANTFFNKSNAEEALRRKIAAKAQKTSGALEGPMNDDEEAKEEEEE